MKILPIFVRFLLMLWVIVLLFRSGLYISRIFHETKQYFSTPADHPSKNFLPSIQPCSLKPSSKDIEKYQLWQYRNFGVKCEN